MYKKTIIIHRNSVNAVILVYHGQCDIPIAATCNVMMIKMKKQTFLTKFINIQTVFWKILPKYNTKMFRIICI